MINVNFVKELVLGSLMCLVGMILIVTVSNGICNFLANFKVPCSANLKTP
jgi:hypothetical protein